MVPEQIHRLSPATPQHIAQLIFGLPRILWFSLDFTSLPWYRQLVATTLPLTKVVGACHDQSVNPNTASRFEGCQV